LRSVSASKAYASATRAWNACPAPSMRSVSRPASRRLASPTATGTSSNNVTSGDRPPVASAFIRRTSSSGSPRPYPWYANVDNSYRSATTTSPAASAAASTSSTCTARAARARNSSARAGRSSPSRISRRISSPTGVPPGSRPRRCGTPCAANHSASSRTCVLLPDPSIPSNTTNTPRRSELAPLTPGIHGCGGVHGHAAAPVHVARPPHAPRRSLVVIQPQVRDLLFAHQVAQRVLQLHVLDEQVVLRVQVGRHHRALEVERQPLLDPAPPRAHGQVQDQRPVQHARRGEERVLAQEVHLDLHRVAEPTENVQVVRAFLVVPTRRVVVDPHLVVHVPVQLRVEIRLEHVLQHAQLRLFLRLERVRVIQHRTIAVAEDVRAEPAV